MKRLTRPLTLALAGLAVALCWTPAFADEPTTYLVTVTNVTRSQIFAPVLVASHRDGVALFAVGEEAGPELAALAEGGDVMPLAALLQANAGVYDVAHSGGMLAPGQSVTVAVVAGGSYRAISLAAMLVSTNDAFMGANGVYLPKEHRVVTASAAAYDAGSEPNDELCANIPGPPCGGAGGSPGAGGEGFVHVHAGIHGSGELDPAELDWRNPVAHIEVRRAGGDR